MHFSPNHDNDQKFTILSATEAVYQHTSRYKTEKTLLSQYSITTSRPAASRDRTHTNDKNRYAKGICEEYVDPECNTIFVTHLH